MFDDSKDGYLAAYEKGFVMYVVPKDNAVLDIIIARLKESVDEDASDELLEGWLEENILTWSLPLSMSSAN